QEPRFKMSDAIPQSMREEIHQDIPHMEESSNPALAAEAKKSVQGLAQAPESRDSSKTTPQSVASATNRNIKIVAIDLQPMTPLDGITTLFAVITHPSNIPAPLLDHCPTNYVHIY